MHVREPLSGRGVRQMQDAHFSPLTLTPPPFQTNTASLENNTCPACGTRVARRLSKRRRLRPCWRKTCKNGPGIILFPPSTSQVIHLTASFSALHSAFQKTRTTSCSSTAWISRPGARHNYSRHTYLPLSVYQERLASAFQLTV